MEIVTIVIPMKLPGLNDYINVCRSNRYQAAKYKKQVENDCLIFINNVLKGRKFSSIGIRFRWFEDNQRRDKDNIAFAKKFILDALQTAKVLVNDGWSQIRYFHDEFNIDKKNPRVEIIIEGTK